MDIVKHIKDFGKGVFDSVVTAPYALGDFIARDAKISITGHSLGASLAQYMLIRQGIMVIK